MTAEDAAALIKRQSRDVPLILLKPGIDIDMRTSALRCGMADALPQDAEALLTLIVDRELVNLEARRQRRIAEQNLREAEKRCQLLLDSSVDAIAYVHDGMHIYANRAYSELFGYEDADDLAADFCRANLGDADDGRSRGRRRRRVT